MSTIPRDEALLAALNLLDTLLAMTGDEEVNELLSNAAGLIEEALDSNITTSDGAA